MDEGERDEVKKFLVWFSMASAVWSLVTYFVDGDQAMYLAAMAIYSLLLAKEVR